MLIIKRMDAPARRRAAILEDGWTTSNERDAIRYVQQL
ncbi:hypothetical protein HCH_05094 [Hahella chejuensis KCTC 2396]|uniref:Uncharacterized protein n=1 Tax=Hahella chejuensis (strain KCTC 2396) TaxID=349521 RepID=Q2SC49_HAHCH|nr:hypothetical protein HCH_05094 [Hahella chejuensis KCTC 2396]